MLIKDEKLFRIYAALQAANIKCEMTKMYASGGGDLSQKEVEKMPYTHILLLNRRGCDVSTINALGKINYETQYSITMREERPILGKKTRDKIDRIVKKVLSTSS